MKPTAADQDRFNPRRDKPPVWIEGEFVVTGVVTKTKPAERSRPQRRRSVLGLPHGLGEMVLRLLGVATACAAAIALALVWAMVVG